MHGKSNTTVIGAFVVGAVTLLVAGVLILGGGKLFSEAMTFALHFEGSIKGLNTGAQVQFRGVKVGSVTAIALLLDLESSTIRSRVTIEIPKRAAEIERGEEILREALAKGERRLDLGYALFERLVEKGLRAQLAVQSFVTGQLMVTLDFFPETPVNLSGGVEGIRELPTIPSGLELLSKTLQDLPLNELAENLNETVKGLERIIGSEEVKESLNSLNRGLEGLAAFVARINERSDGVLEGLDGLLVDGRKLVVDVDREIGPLAEGLAATLDDTRRLVKRDAEPTLEEIRRTLKTAAAMLEEYRALGAGLKDVAAEDVPLAWELATTLRSIAEAADSLKGLADLLERHPEALLQGKPD